MALSVSQKVLLQRENSWGSTVGGATPTVFALPIETANLNLVIEPFNDQTKKGTAALDNDIYPTAKRTEGNIEGPFFVDEAAYFLMALMGQTAVTTGATLHTHKFTAKTDFSTNPESLSIDVVDDVETRQAKGCYVNSFTIRFSAAEGIVTYTANITGKDNVDADDSTFISITDPGFADENPPLGWTAALKKDTTNASSTADNEATVLGTANYCQIVDAEFTFNRPTALTYVFCEQQFAERADPGPLECTVRLTADYDGANGKTLTDEYRDDTRSAWLFTLDNNLSGANERQLRIFLPIVSMLDAPQEIDRSDTSMRLNMSLRALNNTNANITGPAVFRTMTSAVSTKYGAG